jgi:hypothetical protein
MDLSKVISIKPTMRNDFDDMYRRGLSLSSSSLGMKTVLLQLRRRLKTRRVEQEKKYHRSWLLMHLLLSV